MTRFDPAARDGSGRFMRADSPGRECTLKSHEELIAEVRALGWQWPENPEPCDNGITVFTRRGEDGAA